MVQCCVLYAVAQLHGERPETNAHFSENGCREVLLHFVQEGKEEELPFACPDSGKVKHS